MGYIFASPVAPVECRITARNDPYLGDSPKDLAIQWCSDGIHWHMTDAFTGLTWSSGGTKAFSLSP